MAKKKTASTKTPKTVEPAPAKKAPSKKAGAKKADGKLSQLDDAAQVLAKASEPMTCPELVQAMADRGLWTSPGGKTPAGTLHASLLREINLKGKESRFVKTERGKFALAK